MTKNTLLISLFLCFLGMSAQNIKNTSTNDSTYNALREAFYFFRNKDSLKAMKCVKDYLHEAKNEKNIGRILSGVYFKSLLKNNDSIYLDYVDSIINFYTVNPNNLLPAIAYQDKYKFYYEKNEHSKSLASLLKALNYSEQLKNDSLKAIYCHRMGIYKMNSSRFDEALELFDKSFKYCISKKNNCSDNNHVSIILSLANYYKKNNLDSISFKYLVKAEKFAQKNHVLNVEGYINYRKGGLKLSNKEYSEAVKYFSKSIPQLLKDENFKLIFLAYHYISVSNQYLENYPEVILYSKKIDSLYNIYPYNSKALPMAFHNLRRYSKRNGDKEKEIHYLEKLIKAEKNLAETSKKFRDEMSKNYDIPKLKEEKERLILELENELALSNYYKYSFGGLSTLSFIGIFLFYRRQKKLKKQFDFISTSNSLKSNQTLNKTRDLNLPKEVVNNIQDSLEKFKYQNAFLNPEITLISLAKDLNTNANYLSKFINYFEGCNFSQYVNTLRIDFILEELKKNHKLRNYTIKAIANEAGFKNSESFSNAFYKRTGLKPSYFIKQLIKQEIKSSAFSS